MNARRTPSQRPQKCPQSGCSHRLFTPTCESPHPVYTNLMNPYSKNMSQNTPKNANTTAQKFPNTPRLRASSEVLVRPKMHRSLYSHHVPRSKSRTPKLKSNLKPSAPDNLMPSLPHPQPVMPPVFRYSRYSHQRPPATFEV